MKEQLQHRLQALKTEQASGQQLLAELEAKQANLHSTLLRIQGAIQVLEEELIKAVEHEAAAPELLTDTTPETPSAVALSNGLLSSAVTH